MKMLTPLPFLLLAALYSCDKNTSLITEPTTDNNISAIEYTKSIDLTPKYGVKQLVPDKTIYEFINSCITSDTSYFKRCKTIIGREQLPPFSTKRDSLQIIQADSIFTKEDADFIFKQARFSTNFKLSERKLTQVRTVILPGFDEAFGKDRHKFWSNLLKECGGYCSSSMPLFSVDRKTAIIRLSYTCGTLCAYGGQYIYKKVNGKWKCIAIWNEWVS